MGDVSAGFHVGSFAQDPDAALRQVFEVRSNQPDGLSSILKYCQDQSGFKPGNTDTTRFMEALSEFRFVIKPKPDPTAFVRYMSSGEEPSVRGMVENLPDNAKLLRFLDTAPSGDYKRALVQFITELEGDFLTVYIVTIAMTRNGRDTDERVTVFAYSFDRDEMANRAQELVDKIREKERLEDWAKRISSSGYA